MVSHPTENPVKHIERERIEPVCELLKILVLIKTNRTWDLKRAFIALAAS